MILFDFKNIKKEVVGYDEANDKLISYPPMPFKVKMVHSLKAISKWESITLKPFYSNNKNFNDFSIYEQILYFKCMITDFIDYTDPDKVYFDYVYEVPDEIFMNMPQNLIAEILEDMNSKKTPTTVQNEGGDSSMSFMSSEVYYSSMITCGIDLSCDTWEFSKLIMLINVRQAMISPKKEMSPKERAARDREINERNRKLFEEAKQKRLAKEAENDS